MPKIAEVVVSSAQASIDFTGIPQTYKHLALVITGRSDAAAAYTRLYLRLNGDSGANYDHASSGGNGNGTAFSEVQAAGTSADLQYFTGNSAPANAVSSYAMELLNYTGTAARKIINYQGNLDQGDVAGNFQSYTGSAAWRSVAAINEVTLSLASGNFMAGTVATLYGIDGTSSGPGVGAAQASAKVQLDWANTADISVTPSLNMWTDFTGSISFNVDDAASLVEIDVSGTILAGIANGAANTRVVIDGSTIKTLGGGFVASATNTYVNALEGAGTVTLSGLAAGAHTLKVQVYSTVASKAIFNNAASAPDQYPFAIRVIERKSIYPLGSVTQLAVKAPGGMAKISEVVLSNAQASIDFSAIPQNYRHLRLVLTARGDASQAYDDVQFQFNGDTGGNYNDEAFYATASSPASDEHTGFAYGRAMTGLAASAPTAQAATATIDLPTYAGTTFNKTWTTVGQARVGTAGGNNRAYQIAGTWANTAAISSIHLVLSAGNFLAGTIATLYGIDDLSAPSAVSTVSGAQASSKVQLDGTYNGADLANSAVSANTWTTVASAFSFTVDDPASVVEIDLGGLVRFNATGNTATDIQTRLLIDGTVTKSLSGGTGGVAVNILSGASPVVLTGLTAGTHTVALQMYAVTTGGGYYLRPNAGNEYLNCRVVERKQIAPTTYTPITNQTNKVQLDWSQSTDIVGLALTAATWTNVGAAQSFTVDDAASLVEVIVAGNALLGGTNLTGVGTRLLIDGTTTKSLGGAFTEVGGQYSNPFSGAQPIPLTGLTAGTHTVQVQALSGSADSLWLRPVSSGSVEFMTIRVIERKTQTGAVVGAGSVVAVSNAPQPAVRATNSVAQSIPNSAWTTASFDTTSFDQGASSPQHSTSTTTSRLLCQKPGVYSVDATAVFASSSAGLRGLQFMKNGVQTGAYQLLPPLGSNETGLSISDTFSLVTGDYLEMQVIQSSGGALNLDQAMLSMSLVSTAATTVTSTTSGAQPSSKVQLDYQATSDLVNGAALTSNAWADVGPAQPFTVDDPASIIEIDVFGGVLLGGNTGGTMGIGSRLLIDGTITRPWGSGWTPANGAYGNALAGGSTVQLTGLSAGAHTVKVQYMANLAGGSGSAYCQPVSSPGGYQQFGIRVIERKQIAPTTYTPVTNQTNKMQLDWTATTDLMNNVALAAANTWTDVTGTTQTFTVDDAASLVEVAVSGNLQAYTNGQNPGTILTRILIDGTISKIISGTSIAGSASSSYYGNALAGSTAVQISGLSAGTHTVKVQVEGPQNWTIDLRPVTYPFSHSLSLRVIERKTTTSAAVAPPTQPTLATMQAILPSDVAMSSATWTDGPSLTLSAGTWLIQGTMTSVQNSGSAHNVCKLWDGTTVYASTEQTESAAGFLASMHVSAIVTPTTSTAYKLSGYVTGGAGTIKASVPDGGGAANATMLTAIRVA